MRILMSFGRRAGLPALLALTLSGCYIPGGGWTMRTGADLRTRYKPSVFFEMVDTRWDEYNRVACQNTQCQPRHHSTSRNGSGTDLSSGHSGCMLGLPLPGTLTPVPATGPMLTPGYVPDANRSQPPTDAGNQPQPGAFPQPPSPQYQFPSPATAPQYPVPQPFPNNVPPDPAEDVPGNAPQNEPSQAPGVTATGQQDRTSPYGAWPGSTSGPALMLPAPDPVVPAYGDSGLNSLGPAEPASATNSSAGLELSGYEQATARRNASRFTAGSKVPHARPPVRRRASTDPTDPSGANRHFTRPRI